jgi:hypothetical protein
MAHKVRVQQYCGPRDLLERLARDLRALQQATTAAAARWLAAPACAGCQSRHGQQGSTGLSDETLLDKLAGSNPELRKQLKGLLGSDNFETPDDPVPTVPGSTKH